MLNSKYVRDHFKELKDSLDKRKSNYNLDEIIKSDEESRNLKTQLQQLQKQKNILSKDISDIKKKNNQQDFNKLLDESAEIKNQISEIEQKLIKYETKITNLIWNLPNILHESVPYGESSENNIEIKSWFPDNKNLDELKKINISKTHEDILIDLDLLDTKRGAKVAGSRFYYLKNDLVLLEQSLIRFAIDELSKKGFTPVSPPFMIKKEYYKNVTALAEFEESLYKISNPKELQLNKESDQANEELFLISTSEHPIAAMHSDEVFSGNQLPLKYIGISPCFRREAGSHGKDTKGIFRVHQFNKIEQFIFSRQEDSWSYFDELLNNAEQIYQKLQIPYRIVNICTGDIGIVAAKKFDIEAYMPIQKEFREIVSCSNCTDWQSLRLNIRYDEKNERKYVYTLNSTALATTRTIVAIVENYLNNDGTISVPDVLIPYFGKSKITKK
ncbi:MAG: serine--tRNA ligase [Candidatus Marsarchaeota archaeon]|nr:serine--tRNA ligase [Candidatus Marsarchaeota archaeon]MCL5094939.1 serine--tRNA ligase [Candidatus Marsarchaeota archaeon]